jgi:biopolymer transport protein ExbD
MELISFNLSKFLFSILLFFGGCSAFEPPAPVTITTPKTIITEKDKDFYSNSLLIDMSKKQKLLLTYTDQDKNKKSIEIKANNEKELQKTIQQAINWAGNRQELKVLIQGDNKAPSNTFQTVIKALTAKGLYKYKLITTPE